MRFSLEEKRNMLKVFYICQRNSVRASEMYFEMYPECPQPQRTIFQRLDYNLSQYGSFSKPRNKYGSKISNEEKEQVINEVN